MATSHGSAEDLAHWRQGDVDVRDVYKPQHSCGIWFLYLGGDQISTQVLEDLICGWDIWLVPVRKIPIFFFPGGKRNNAAFIKNTYLRVASFGYWGWGLGLGLGLKSKCRITWISLAALVSMSVKGPRKECETDFSLGAGVKCCRSETHTIRAYVFSVSCSTCSHAQVCRLGCIIIMPNVVRLLPGCLSSVTSDLQIRYTMWEVGHFSLKMDYSWSTWKVHGPSGWPIVAPTLYFFC